MAGYSETPLARKLGLTRPLTIVTINAPLPMGFVDVKVCAVTDVWSGLTLVIRKIERAKNG